MDLVTEAGRGNLICNLSRETDSMYKEQEWGFNYDDGRQCIDFCGGRDD